VVAINRNGWSQSIVIGGRNQPVRPLWARNPAEFAQFQSVIQQYNASGERFRIDSHCQSVCTMFLSIRNVCVSPGATLLFHAGGADKRASAPAARSKCSAPITPPCSSVSPPTIMEKLDFHPISGSELIKRFGYPACR
jgi:hypothetical protein